MLNDIVRENGAKGLKAALIKLNYNNDCHLIENLFEILSRAEFAVGLHQKSVMRIYSMMLQVSAFLPEMLNRYQDGRNFKIQSTVRALTCFVAATIKHDLEKMGNEDKVLELATRLKASVIDPPSKEIIENAMFRTHLDTPSTQPNNTSADDNYEEFSKPLHDNDDPFDFHKVSFFPTANEVMTDCTMKLLHRGWMGNEKAVDAKHIDRQFRFLREDMIAPLRDEVQQLRNPKNAKRLYAQPLMVNVDYGREGSFSTATFTMEVVPPSIMQGQLDGFKKESELANYFQEFGKRILERDSVLLFFDMEPTRTNNTSTATTCLKHIGVIVNRDAHMMANAYMQNKVLLVGVKLQGASLHHALKCFAGRAVDTPHHRRTAFAPFSEFVSQARTQFFAYEPIVHCLKDINTVPLRNVLILGQTPSARDDLERVDIPADIQKLLKSDQSQANALQMSLRQQVSLIQGPPGTGKTFLGVQIVKSLLQHHRSRSHTSRSNPFDEDYDFDEIFISESGDQPSSSLELKILCICYTNHALDSFLESLLDNGISQETIIRLGSQTKISERMKACCLDEKSDPLAGSEGRLLFSLKDNLKELQQRINSTLSFLQNDRNLSFNAYSWGAVKKYLETNGLFDWMDSLSVPKQNDGFQRVGRAGNALPPHAYWDAWCKGKSRPTDIATAEVDEDIWELSNPEREALRKKWYEDYLNQKYISRLAEMFEEYDKTRIHLENLKARQKLRALKQAKIIACTTTYAAKYRKLLDSCRPTIVLVEEAAEIHESHILCNLSPDTKQLIMIGDHLQLRPKLNHYPLRWESGQGINFDVSLFERLVKGNYPVATLAVQWRMRPEISSFIRDMTYPELLDHASTQGRDNIRGMVKNIAFIDHREKEKKEHQDTLALGLDTRSKINLFEVKMVLSMVKYLLQQGYKAEDIVILTPYLGQLMELRREMRSSCWDLEAIVGLEDQSNLQTTGMLEGEEEADEKSTEKSEKKDEGTKTSMATTKASVRVATIDNYQGEESKIVIVSLVRSNDEGDVGFVGGPERINVLFSRARDGFYVLGNSETLLNARVKKSKELWTNLFALLTAGNYVVEGFPIMCANHQTVQYLKTPQDFVTLAPHGGCSKPCNTVVSSCPLKHTCPRRCHPISDSGEPHRSMVCEEKLTELCSRNHPTVRICSQPFALPCNISITSLCDAGKHALNHVCCKTKPSSCQACIKTANRLAKIEQENGIKLAALEKEVDELEAQAAEKAAHRQMEEKVKVIERKKQLLLQEAALLYNEVKTARQQAKDGIVVEEETKQVVNSVPKAILKRNKNSHITPSHENVSQANDADSPTSTATPPSATAKDIIQTKEDATAQIQHTTSPSFVVEEVLSTNAAATNSIPKETIQKTKVLTWLQGENWRVCLGYLREINPQLSLDATQYEDTSLYGLDVMICFLLCHAKSVTFKGDDQTIEQKIRNAYEALHVSYWTEKHTLKPSQLVFLNKEEALELFLLLGTHVFAFADHLEASHKQLFDKYHGLKASLLAKSCGLCLGKLCPTPFQPKNQSVPPQGINTGKEGGKGGNLDKDAEIMRKWNKIKKEWAQKKKPSDAKSTPSEAMEMLLKMTGLQKVKDCFIQRYHKVEVSKEQELALEDFNFNTRFDGNPGTGKTTVAELFCQFLIEIELLPETAGILKKTGSELANDGVSKLEKSLNELKDCGGGVVFVDEAYQLVAERDGKRVLDFILGHSEKMKGEFGKIVWIFAGYKRQMDELFEHNPGLPSRFKDTFHFEDYSDKELENIFRGLMTRCGDHISANQTMIAQKKPKKKEEEKPAPKPPTSLSIPAANNNRFRYGMSSFSAFQPDQVDTWGNTWHWDDTRATWYDDYGNISGPGVAGLGSDRNPIVSADRKMWNYNAADKLFRNLLDRSEESADYPGKPKATPPPPPKPAQKPKTPFTVTDDKWIRIAMRRLGRLRNTPGFGNARAVRNLFDTAHNRLVDRYSNNDDDENEIDKFKFVRDDLLGPKASIENLKACSAYAELMELEGLAAVKEAINQLIDVIVVNSDREDQEKPVLEIALNRIFLGNPGTGKTTVAGLYARMLSHLSLLSKGEVIAKTASDFIGGYLGQSENQTRGILEQAKGCVLVIDEAYGLYQETGQGNEPYREAVINTLVEQIQGVPGEDRAVVLLGYRKEMENMLTKANPGLARRFQLENALEFEDYTDEELVRILEKKVTKSMGLKISHEDAVFAVKQLAKARAQAHFGNAGAVNNLLSQAKERFAKRIKRMKDVSTLVDSDLLLQQDFVSEDWTDEVLDIDQLFAGFVGCDSIREKLLSLKAVYEYYKHDDKDPKEHMNFNYIFTGSPGTGKTSVARLMGKMFQSLGLIPSDEVIETSPSKLQTGYVGQTGKRTREVFLSARGKVLFIDEAYGLDPAVGGSFMQEAVDEIVQILTDKEFKGKMIIILAGYEQQINAMLQTNAGLQSRFTEKIHFEDFTVDRVMEMMHKQLTSPPNALAEDIKEVDDLAGFATGLLALPKFANGRDIDTFVSHVKEARAVRVMARKEHSQLNRHVFQESDLQKAIQQLMQTRMSLPTNSALRPKPLPSSAPTATATATSTTPNTAFSSTPSAAASENPNKGEEDQKEDWDLLDDKDDDDDDTKEEDDKQTSDDTIDWGTDKRFLQALQTLLDTMGLSDDINQLTSLSPETKHALITKLMEETGYSRDHIEELFTAWQDNHEKVQDILARQAEEEYEAREFNRKALVPIWRCAVCGRADKPFIVCTVAPYVVRYDEIDL